jgi:hypothetical protein
MQAQRFYIRTVREDVRDAMQPLEQKINRAAAGADSSGKLKKINTRPT